MANIRIGFKMEIVANKSIIPWFVVSVFNQQLLSEYCQIIPETKLRGLFE